MKAFLYSIVIGLFFVSCKKSKSSNELLGEWKLVGTSHIGAVWTAIDASEEQTLILKDDGAYILNTSHLSLLPQGCKGTFEVANNVLIVTPDCMSTPPLTGPLKITLSADTLILDHMITSSGVRTKYVRQ